MASLTEVDHVSVPMTRISDFGAQAPPSCAMFSLDHMNCDDNEKTRKAGTALNIQSTIPSIATTKVSQLFFSAKNFHALQVGIRYRVWVETGGRYTISNQSEAELGTIMRGVYLEYGRNIADKVVEQVRGLNAHVLDYAVPKILSELESRAHYMQDISQQPVPLENGAATSVKGSGSKQLEMPFFF